MAESVVLKELEISCSSASPSLEILLSIDHLYTGSVFGPATSHA